VGAAAESVSDSLNAGVDVVNQKVHKHSRFGGLGLDGGADTIASGVGNVTQHAATFGLSLSQLKDGAANLAGSASDGAAGLKQHASGALGATSDAMSASVGRTGSAVRDRAGDARSSGPTPV
jgi:hypothetical protein